MAYGRQALTEILLRQPELDAVICSHESIALGMMFECQRRLIKIPKIRYRLLRRLWKIAPK